MGYGTLVKKQFTVPKLSFYFIFWGIHFFLFGFGWYGSPSFPHAAVVSGR
jgi:NADPH oxidase